MNILVLGSGGREHALAWKLSKSETVKTVFIAPGNPGCAEIGVNVPVAVSDFEGLLEVVERNDIELTIVGPEQPLVDGIVDLFRGKGHPIVGPTAMASRLEGSKAFAKDFMTRHGIPTAAYQTFTREQYEEACTYLAEQSIPIVIKASGLAAGKGAVVCFARDEAEATLKEMLVDNRFGEASASVVIEEFMEGEEASVFAICDGSDYVCLAPAQDHKQIGEGDTGPNTGGMGAYAPAPVVTDEIMLEVKRTIIEPVLDGMVKDCHPYTGFLFAGLMLTSKGPRVVEYNCRMGDPETQVVLPLLDNDLGDLLMACTTGGLGQIDIRLKDGAAACVVMASAGYPGSYEKGKVITGVPAASSSEGTLVFQAGTRRAEGDDLETAGGRVLNVVGLGDSLDEALHRAYSGVEQISFDGAQFRRDIGQKGLRHLVDDKV